MPAWIVIGVVIVIALLWWGLGLARAVVAGAAAREEPALHGEPSLELVGRGRRRVPFQTEGERDVWAMQVEGARFALNIGEQTIGVDGPATAPRSDEISPDDLFVGALAAAVGRGAHRAAPEVAGIAVHGVFRPPRARRGGAVLWLTVQLPAETPPASLAAIKQGVAEVKLVGALRVPPHVAVGLREETEPAEELRPPLAVP